MNFTREPIIETIITPREGYKLAIRNSKGGGQEEYQVDAIEVVSFGHSFFFRSLERPKSFLVPVSDYEVIEVKEARVALKNVTHERTIKIGGGREPPPKPPRETEEAYLAEEEGEGEIPEAAPHSAGEQRSDRKRDRRRNRRRRGGEERPKIDEAKLESPAPSVAEKGGGAHDETQVSSSLFSTLLPPPTTLISQTLGRYKDKDVESAKEDLLPNPVEEKKKKENPEEPPFDAGPSATLHRALPEEEFFYSPDQSHFII